MAYQFFRRWLSKAYQRLSKLEQHLVISYTKGPKDPQRIRYLVEALKPDLSKRISLGVSTAKLKTYAPNIVDSVAIASAIAMNLDKGLNVKGFFWDMKRAQQSTYLHMLDSKGHYINHSDLLALYKTEMQKIVHFFFDEEKKSVTDLMNKKHLEQNFDIFHDYIDSLITAINDTTDYAHYV